MDTDIYYKGLATYSYSESKKHFEHDLDEDYQLFIVWENGRSFENEIIKAITLNFDVISRIHVKWTDVNAVQNFNRLYKALNNSYINNKAETMGAGEFVCLVVRDNQPEYQYRKTVSGAIELVNIRTVKVKREVRALCGGYYVHSSASPEEFYEQSVLLFGNELLIDLLNGKHEKLFLNHDLHGVDGWNSFSELFTVLRYSSKYLVLRNFEFLPFDFFANDKDVDILCENVIDFISASNAKILSLTDGGAKLSIKVENKEVPFDIRFVGDNYYNPSWARDMLEQRVKTIDNIYVPRIDDYFFSLLYHSVLQKPEIKPTYINRFKILSKQLDFDFFDNNKVGDKRYLASLIEGFLIFKNYSYTKPKDSEVYINYSVLKYISKDLGGTNSRKILNFAKSIIPRKFIDIVPPNIKIKINKLML